MCQDCGIEGTVDGDSLTLTLDHIDPDGGHGIENLQLLCASCNSSKGRRSLAEHNKPVRFADGVVAQGFTIMPNAVLNDASLTIGARMTYLQLRQYAWKDAECFPGQKRLAEMLGVTEKTLRGYIAELVEAKLVSVRKRGQGRTSVYTLFEPTMKGSGYRSGAVADTEEVNEVEVKVGSSLRSEPTCEPPQKPRKPRERNPVWDALDAIWGAPTNAVETSRRTRTVKLLRESLQAEGIPLENALTEIEARREAYMRRWDGIAAPTEIALASRWSDCKPMSKNGKPLASALERARAWVTNVGWQYPDDALAEELSRFDLNAIQKKSLAALAVSMQTNGP